MESSGPIERTEIRLGSPCEGILLIQAGSIVTKQDLFQRSPVARWEYADNKAAFAALCCLRAATYEEFGGQK